MKIKLVLVVLLVCGGCDLNHNSQGAENVTRVNSAFSDFEVIDFAGCEYVVYGEMSKGGLTHKGNCKYCEAKK